MKRLRPSGLSSPSAGVPAWGRAGVLLLSPRIHLSPRDRRGAHGPPMTKHVTASSCCDTDRALATASFRPAMGLQQAHPDGRVLLGGMSARSSSRSGSLVHRPSSRKGPMEPQTTHFDLVADEFHRVTRDRQPGGAGRLTRFRGHRVVRVSQGFERRVGEQRLRSVQAGHSRHGNKSNRWS